MIRRRVLSLITCITDLVSDKAGSKSEEGALFGETSRLERLRTPSFWAVWRH